MGSFREQAARFGADMIQERATRADISQRPFPDLDRVIPRRRSSSKWPMR